MAERRHSIVCLSSQRWDDAMWTNKQHIMSRLGRVHDVHYVNFGPFSLKKIALSVASRPERLRRPHRLFTAPSVSRYQDVKLLDFYGLHFPEKFRHGNPLRVFGQFDMRVSLLHRYLRREGIEDAILWVYHPGYGAGVARLPHKLLVYDCVDEYTAFPEFRGAERWMRERERGLCERADLVFCTAPELHERKRAFNPDHTHLVHNVGDAEHFRSALDPELVVPADLERIGRPRIGFIGAVSDYKLNADWLLHLARARPDWNLVVIGPTGIADPGTDVSALASTPNVHLLGHRAYAELPSYLKGFDVAVIPYRINDYTRSVFPIKFFEFLATGRPVVISNLPALKDFYGAVGVATSAEEFVLRCEEALAEPEHGKDERVRLAEKHSWPQRIAKLMGHIETRLDEESVRDAS